MPLARKFLTDPETVSVANFKQMEVDLGAMSYFKEVNGKPVRVDDIYNVPSAEVMDALNQLDSGVNITCTIVQDSSADVDGHPEINSAVAEQ